MEWPAYFSVHFHKSRTSPHVLREELVESVYCHQVADVSPQGRPVPVNMGTQGLLPAASPWHLSSIYAISLEWWLGRFSSLHSLPAPIFPPPVSQWTFLNTTPLWWLCCSRWSHRPNLLSLLGFQSTHTLREPTQAGNRHNEKINNTLYFQLYNCLYTD